MLNLFPEPEKKRLARQYVMRIAVVALWFTAALGLVGIALAVPSFVSVQIKKGLLEEEAASIREAIAREGSDETETFLRETQERMDLLAAYEEPRHIQGLLADVLARAPAGVSVRGVTYTRRETTWRIVVRGVADARQSAVTFRQQLAADERYESVELPLENLASSENIEFTLTITLARPASEEN